MMLFKKTKQLFAALLCLCMVAAILPAMPAAQAADAIEIDFTSDSIALFTAGDDITYEDTNNTWQYYGDSGHRAAVNRAEAAYYGSYAQIANPFWEITNTAVGNWAAFELNGVPSGEYDISLTYSTWTSGGVNDIYIIPYKAEISEADFTDENKVGSVNFYEKRTSTYAEAAGTELVGKKTITSNDNKVIMVVRCKSVVSTGVAFVSGITFAPKSNDIIVDVTKAGLAHFASVDGITFEATNNVWRYVDCYNTTHGPNGAEYPPYYSNSDTYVDMRYMHNGSWVAFEIANVAAGDYDVTFNYKVCQGGGIADIYLVPATGNVDISKCTAANSVGKVSFYGTTGSTLTATSKQLKSITVPTKGNYYLIFKGTGRAQQGATTVGTYWTGLKLKYTGEPSTPAAGDAAFSDVYAYVRENFDGGKSSYEVTLVGGIDVADLSAYNAVGFNIASDALGVDESVSDTAVFKTITLSDGAALDAAEDFGSDYIFVSKYTFSTKNALEFMTVNAFAEAANGDIIEGSEFIVQIGK